MLYVNKTKKIVFDSRSVGDHDPVSIHREVIEQVAAYKYLGVYFDFNQNWAR